MTPQTIHLAGPRPSWAVAAVVAQQRRDESDFQSDYFGSKAHGPVVVLAWSGHKRHTFPEMRKAALLYQETAHLGEKAKANEHRENYSMGHGNYLSVGSYNRDGWKISKRAYGLDELEPAR